MNQKENTRPRSQQDDRGKKGNNDSNSKNAGKKGQNRRGRRRSSYNSQTRSMKGDDLKQRNGANNYAPNMVAAAN